MTTKITELETTRYRTSYQKDRYGNRQRIQTPYLAKRPIKVVEGGRRFAHFFIDGIIYSILFYPLDKLMGYIDFGAATIGYALLITIFPIYLGYSVYYFFFEYFTQSTPGKFLTKSIVINEYGSKPTRNELIVRSLVRLVPLEPFSCVSERGWHDRWSGTWVISKDENQKIQEKLKE